MKLCSFYFSKFDHTSYNAFLNIKASKLKNNEKVVGAMHFSGTARPLIKVCCHTGKYVLHKQAHSFIGTVKHIAKLVSI